MAMEHMLLLWLIKSESVLSIFLTSLFETNWGHSGSSGVIFKFCVPIHDDQESQTPCWTFSMRSGFGQAFQRGWRPRFGDDGWFLGWPSLLWSCWRTMRTG
ncbi:hypothetical protein ACA910_003008 [Epithemia clementina (nom. ined.)]